MWHLKSRGYIFDKNAAGANPVEEYKWLLSAELVSVHNFELCLNTESAAALHGLIDTCHAIKSESVHLISERLAAHNEAVPQSPDLWHSFIETVNAGAALLGDEVIIAAFRKHELALFSEYENRVGKFGSDDLLLLQKYLLPNQVKVLELLGAVKSEQSDALIRTDPLNLNFA